MNKCISLSVISLVCVVALTTAYGPMGTGGYAGYQSYVPMYYGGGGYGIGGGSGGFGGGGLFSSKFQRQFKVCGHTSMFLRHFLQMETAVVTLFASLNNEALQYLGIVLKERICPWKRGRVNRNNRVTTREKCTHSTLEILPFLPSESIDKHLK